MDMMRGITGVKRKNALLGDILELGDMSYDIHYSVGRLASSYGLHYLFLLGEYAEAVFNGAVGNGFDKDRIFILNDLPSYSRISEFIKSKMGDDDIILVKGSHAMNLGRISELMR
jgi:UDP-N-acetylmuramoyl-tripeptide--D-alanyl-D-alanine ligase